jgi:DNA-binding transcriptional MerR regulator
MNNKISASELAALLGISRSRLSYWHKVKLVNGERSTGDGRQVLFDVREVADAIVKHNLPVAAEVLQALKHVSEPTAA